MKTKEMHKSWLFEYSSPILVLVIGLLGFFALSISAMLTNTSFGGIFYVQYVESQSIGKALFENFVSSGILMIVFIFFSRNLNNEINVLGVVNAVLISRLPFILFTIFNIGNYIRFILIINLSKFKHRLYDFTVKDSFIIILFSLFAFSILIFSISLLYKGIRSAIGEKFARKDKLLFFGSFLLAEIISKTIISMF